MLNAIKNLSNMAWGDWLIGLWGAFISSAAGAGSSALGTMIVDPNDFNIHEGLRKLLQVMAFSALIPGTVSLLKYLQLHPSPDRLQQALADAASHQAQASSDIKEATKNAPKPPTVG